MLSHHPLSARANKYKVEANMPDKLSLIEQNRQLSEEVKRRIDQITAINAVASAVGNSLDLDKTLETALQTVLSVVGAEAGGISLIDENANELVLRAQEGWLHDFVVTNPMRIPMGEGMSGEVITQDTMIAYNNLDGTESYAVPSFRKEHFRSIAMAPMHTRGIIIGILSIMSHSENSFDEGIINVLQAVADTVGVAIGNAKLYEDSVENEHRLTAILHSTADGIIATDHNSRIVTVNHTAETMLHLKMDSLINMPLREAPIPSVVRDSLLNALSSREEGADKAFKVTVNQQVISVMVSPIYRESQIQQDGQTDGWVIVLQDVTHLREAEITRAQFMQAAAHDMRNPISVTQSSLAMLERMVTDESCHGMINIAMDAVKRLNDLIDDLLHLEHIESGYNFDMEEINLLEILTEISNEAQMLMITKSITFMQVLQHELPPMKADLHWLKRAIHNYLSNASKYTQEGGKVTLGARTENGHVYIEVVDNGPGIPRQAQARLFERFYRVDRYSEIPGTGLGLAIVKSVADAHRGDVYVKSSVGKGSTFGLKLPVERDEP
jgi:PAS domain S-box-containing protein